VAPLIERYMRSGTMDAKSRTRWCGCCGILSARIRQPHQQYEKFYGGSPAIVKQNVYRNFDFKRATALVDAALRLPPVKT